MIAAVGILLLFEILMTLVGIGVYTGFKSSDKFLILISLVGGFLILGATYYLLVENGDSKKSGD